MASTTVDGTMPPSQTSEAVETSVFMGDVTQERLCVLNDTQRGFVISIRSVESTEALTGNALKRFIADMYPPVSLFAEDLFKIPSIFKSLRDFLDSRGANLQQHTSRRIMLTLASQLYEEREDTQAAMEIANLLVAAGRRTRRTDTETNPPSKSTPANIPFTSVPHNKAAHNVAMRLKDRENKFSGSLEESWMEYVDEYMQICRDYNLSQSQKLQYLHNVLHGDAKRYYLDTVDNYATTFQQAIDMIKVEYNSPVRQARVKNYLNSLRITNFLNEGKNIDVSLAKVYRMITRMSRRCPKSHRGDAHKLEFLRNAVVGYAWSLEPLSRMETHQLSFQQLYVELEAALQLEKEPKLAQARDSVSTKAGFEYDEKLLSNVHFTGQGRYGRHPSFSSEA